MYLTHETKPNIIFSQTEPNGFVALTVTNKWQTNADVLPIQLWTYVQQKLIERMFLSPDDQIGLCCMYCKQK